MQYKSPMPLLRYAGVDVRKIDVAKLNRAQKELLTEVDIAESKSLLIDGDELTKDDIIFIFDELKDTQTLQFHQWIYDSPRLLKLIQHDEMEVSKKGIFFDRSWSYHGNFSAFKEFISPYLAQPLAKAIDRAFQAKKFNEAELMMADHYLIWDAYFDETFGRLRRSLRSLVQEIKTCRQGGAAFHRLNLDYINRAFIGFLNALPEQLSSDRKAIVAALIDLSVEVQHREPQFCHDLYLVLKKVKCDQETQKIISENLAICEGAKNKKENASPWRFIGMAIFLLTVLMRACT